MKTVSLKEAWEGEADCVKCAIRTSVLFAGLREQDFEKIHKPIDQFTLPPGSVLYRGGDRADFMFTVRTGVVKLVQYLRDGSQRIVRLSRTTDVLGLESLLEKRYQHDAIVIHPTEVCRLPVEVVKRLGGENPALYQELMARWHRPR